ncbi:hypothetical protein COCC4DRAFT_30376 [Bipolaris maydis ATCC 48331]|uniref:Uncharacterized protein n=2 Tax=Cochliobolus heterostrophus TaxID=5016 RepID=M2T247_COCH5|nr:uncharacterized protein COCC4DRAFT_30376 [Bipolaris maydis ATCC 48331]EMD91685.1 hypothetical protein COCHEDRAFT_1021563 [Bipolaris maydis C5]ENI08559.1 hypothetical protein COCC4DRAFT_30376 [Bipolaris maydis ATCC 48331]
MGLGNVRDNMVRCPKTRTQRMPKRDLLSKGQVGPPLFFWFPSPGINKELPGDTRCSCVRTDRKETQPGNTNVCHDSTDHQYHSIPSV